ncbi:Proline-rich receptor-like protein kinase PERK1 [Bienertia sinuspersici]
MSSPAPVAPPESDTGGSTSPAEQTAPSPENYDFIPPPSIPSLPPLVAPPLPPPIASPALSPVCQPQPQPPSQPQPPPQPQPRPRLLPPPMTKNAPPPKVTSPPNNISPPLVKPIDLTPPPQKETPSPNIIPPPLSRPISITPSPNIIPPPLSRPISIAPSPSTISPPFSKPTQTKPPLSPPTSNPTVPYSPLSPPTSNPTIPYSPPSPPESSHRPKTRPTTHPSLSQPSPQRPKNTPTTPRPPSPLPTSAALPSTPPVALPVPQSPSGGAWIPFTTEAPTPLPLLPALVGRRLPLQILCMAAAVEPKGSNNGASGFVVGLAVGGVLLLILAVVSWVLLVLYKRKKKVDDHGSGKKNASIFSGFEEKSSLPLYTKQGSNVNQELQTMVNLSPPKGSSMATSGTPSSNVGLTPGNGPTFSSGTFTYEELMRATNDFSEQNLLGQGGFGYVHKGVLPNGKQVAVKQLKMGGHQGEREFRAEVETISQINIVGEGQPVMDWPTRLKIAIGSAKGLAYLHEDCECVIRLIETVVSDFGLAKIFSSSNPSVTHMTTRVVGTFGYLAPEYASSGKVTDKSDIYSFGVMLLELITGRPPISNFAIGDGKFDSLADPRLQNNYDVNEMAGMVACAAACVRLSAWRRPKMSQVVRALEGNLSTSELDDGMRPGQSSMHFPYESLDFDARNYLEDMKRMALTNSNGYTTTSRYSENTSEYGLHPSASSTDISQPGRS